MFLKILNLFYKKYKCESCKKDLSKSDIKKAYKLGKPFQGLVCNECVKTSIKEDKEYHKRHPY